MGQKWVVKKQTLGYNLIIRAGKTAKFITAGKTRKRQDDMDIKKDLRITVFGDSIGKGIVTDSGKIEIIKDCAVGLFEGGYGVKVDNRSAYGQSLKRLAQKGIIDRFLQTLDRSQKNAVVLELGGNDADFDWKKVGLCPSEDHSPNTGLKEFATLYAEIVNKLIKLKKRYLMFNLI